MFRSPEWAWVQQRLGALAKKSREDMVVAVTKIAMVEGSRESKRTIANVGRIEASEYYAGSQFPNDMVKALVKQRAREAAASMTIEEDNGQPEPRNRSRAKGGVRR